MLTRTSPGGDTCFRGQQASGDAKKLPTRRDMTRLERDSAKRIRQVIGTGARYIHTPQGITGNTSETFAAEGTRHLVHRQGADVAERVARPHGVGDLEARGQDLEGVLARQPPALALSAQQRQRVTHSVTNTPRACRAAGEIGEWALDSACTDRSTDRSSGRRARWW